MSIKGIIINLSDFDDPPVYSLNESDLIHKILALPEHFSDKHLQAIVDGKIQDKDEVLVKCETKREKTYSSGSGFYHNFKVYYIHLDQQNHITLFPAKQSLEEAYKQWNDKVYTHPDDYVRHKKEAFKAGVEWAKKNNYKEE